MIAGQWAVRARSFTTEVVQDDAGEEDLFKLRENQLRFMIASS
jgi:hypothetical protein